MRRLTQFFSFILNGLVLILCLFSNVVFAKTIMLYDQPKVDAKSVATIDLTKGYIPIFKPTTGDWVKVADPQNGNVGWVKAADLKSNQGATISFTQQFIGDDKTSQQYQIFINGQPRKLTPEQSALLMKNMKLQQINMQQAIQNMVNDFNQFYRDEVTKMGGKFPFAMPVVVIPTQKPVLMQRSTELPTITIKENELK